jgi:FtsH-binding integral membrane protein
MASATPTAALHPSWRFAGRNGLVDKYFYFAMSLVAAAVVVWGFSHTVEQNLLEASPPRPLLLWFHGAAFSGWILFFILQLALVRTRHVKVHRSIGWFGAGLAAVMVPLGVTTSIVMGRFDTYRLHEPGGDAFLIVPLYDMVVFAIFIGMAIGWRKKSDLHRRLIFIGTCCLLDAGFGRIDFLFNSNLFIVCLDAVIALGIVRDLLVDRRVHRVYLTALPLLAIAQTFVIYTWRSGAHWWLNIAHGLLG